MNSTNEVDRHQISLKTILLMMVIVAVWSLSIGRIPAGLLRVSMIGCFICGSVYAGIILFRQRTGGLLFIAMLALALAWFSLFIAVAAR